VTLDLKFRSLHLYHSHILAGVQLTAAWLDLAANRLHLVSNGGNARAVVVAARRGGASEVIAEVGRSVPVAAGVDASSSSQQSSAAAASSSSPAVTSPADTPTSSRTVVLSRYALSRQAATSTELQRTTSPALRNDDLSALLSSALSGCGPGWAFALLDSESDMYEGLMCSTCCGDQCSDSLAAHHLQAALQR